MTDERLVEAEGISLSIRGYDILNDIALRLNTGEIVTLIGPNGAGKTSLVRVVLGLQRPDAGSIWMRPGIRIGYVPQRLVIDDTLPLTVARLMTVSQPADRRQVVSALAETGAEHLVDRPIQRISGGEMQRVMLARALLRAPDLLVLDEPVQGIDFAGQHELYELIGQIRTRRGCGTLMVSHDLHLVMAATDRVICLNHHVCCSGHPEQVSRDPAYQHLFGRERDPQVAVYHHQHDHRHDLHGDVVAPKRGTGAGRSTGAGG